MQSKWEHANIMGGFLYKNPYPVAMQNIYITIALVLALFVQGCANTPQPDAPKTSSAKVIDPTNEDLKVAMMAFLKKTGAPVSSTYNFVRFDLNGDKRREAIAIVNSPYGYWCGTHGCTMLIMKAHDNKFTLVNSIQPVREPIYISRTKTKGWNNLIVRISGRWDETKNVLLRYDGSKYPKNPTKLVEYPVNPINNPDFIRVLYDEGTR